MGLGAFLPFYRTHNALDGDQEPWSFGSAAENVSRVALARRYRLLPYLYTAFHEAASTGLPVVRPLFFADPTDPALRDEDHAFLLGSDVMVQPRFLDDGEHDFRMPTGEWCPFTLAGEDPQSEMAHPILRLREGAIVPVGHGGQTAEEAFAGALTLLISLDPSGRASGRLYEVEGEGFGYRHRGYLLTTYEAVLEDGVVKVRIAHQEGNRPRPVRELYVELLAGTEVLRAKGIDGTPLSVSLNE